MKRSEHNNLKQKQVRDVKIIPYVFYVSNVKLGVVQICWDNMIMSWKRYS